MSETREDTVLKLIREFREATRHRESRMRAVMLLYLGFCAGVGATLAVFYFL